MAVIVNDMSEVNIDADLVRADTELSRTDETLVEMSNGCICCTLRDDLLQEVRKLATAGRFDYLLIESTGISEPLPVAATFDFRDAAGDSLSDVARLDTMVTVVDAVNLLRDYSSHDFLRDRGQTLGAEDDRTLVHLLTDQIEFADVVILNKVADAGPERTDAARKIIRSLNADARIIETNHSQVAAAAILNTGLFDFDAAQQHPMWAKELYGFADHTPRNRGIRRHQPCLPRAPPIRASRDHGGSEWRFAGRHPCQGPFLDCHAARLGGGIFAGWCAILGQALGHLVGRCPARPLARPRCRAQLHGRTLGRTMGRPASGNRVHRHRDGLGRAKSQAGCLPVARRNWHRGRTACQTCQTRSRCGAGPRPHERAQPPHASARQTPHARPDARL